MMRLAFALVAIICALALFADWARAGTYTTTYTMPDGRIIFCTVITDLNDNPILVNCI